MGVFYFPVGDLEEGKLKPVDMGGRDVLVTLVDGEAFAFSRQCPHEDSDLASAGQLVKGADGSPQLMCEGHSYCFDLRNGTCVAPKGGAPLSVLPVEEHEGAPHIKLEW
jgi:nitrite reductase/ring-hydroxylating ferredoxin subunit